MKLDVDQANSVSRDILMNPQELVLKQNYPNPFNSSTRISYSLARTSHVELSIHNMLGQKISTLVNQVQTSGFYTVQWKIKSETSGVYLLKIKTGEFKKSIKMLLLE